MAILMDRRACAPASPTLRPPNRLAAQIHGQDVPVAFSAQSHAGLPAQVRLHLRGENQAGFRAIVIDLWRFTACLQVINR